MKGKKFLAVLMTALILSTTGVCTTSVSAYQEESSTVVSQASSDPSYTIGDDTFYYKYFDNELALTIVDYEGDSKNVVIPEEEDDEKLIFPKEEEEE